MINAKKIQFLAEEFLEGTSAFLVDVKVASGNVIRISLENDDRTSITDCVELSRHIEGSFDREEEDFSLDVGSPGLDQPLKVLRQYLKIIGKQIAVNPIEGKKIQGELVSVEEDEGEFKSLVLKTREKSVLKAVRLLSGWMRSTSFKLES